MKRRFPQKLLSLLLAVCMLAGVFPALTIPASAANIGVNKYGSRVEYSPVTSLYTTTAHPSAVLQGGSAVPQAHRTLRAFSLFDATSSAWNAASAASRANEAAAVQWLNAGGYLLNSFGIMSTTTDLYHGTTLRTQNTASNRDANGLWTTSVKGSTRDGGWHATFDFYGLSWNNDIQVPAHTYASAISNMNHSATGNIGGMLEKGDIEFHFSSMIKTYENMWVVFWRSHDDVRMSMLGEQFIKFTGDTMHRYNRTTANVPDLSNSTAWKGAAKLDELYVRTLSDKDDKNEAYMTSGILVGRDVKGPKIKSVTVTSDVEGKKPIPGGVVTLDNIDSLNRTVYFQVTWDEPVVFSGLTNAQIAALTLQVQTVGSNGTTAMPAEASFLRFAPAISDSTPVMTFEYRLLDPYDGSAEGQARGYSYRFTDVIVGSGNNRALWDSVRDISGNQFSTAAGVRQGDRQTVKISNAPSVDLVPFGISNLRITKDQAPVDIFVKQGELVSVTLELNKALAPSALSGFLTNGDGYQNLPSVTLNVTDPQGKPVTISPVNPASSASWLVKRTMTDSGWAAASPPQHWKSAIANGGTQALSPVSVDKSDGSSISYHVQLYPGYTVTDEDGIIRVESVTAAPGTKDASGYTLMSYKREGGLITPVNLPAAAQGQRDKYSSAPDRQYQLDYIPPEVEVTLEDKGGGIVAIVARVTDKSLWSSSAAIDVAVTGAVTGSIGYQSSADGDYGTAWKSAAAKATQVSFGAPVAGSGDTRYAYGFIKLPDKGEISGITVTVKVSDEAGNTGSATDALTDGDVSWSGYDTAPPVVRLTKRPGTGGADRDAKARVTATDMSGFTVYYLWTEEGVVPQESDWKDADMAVTDIITYEDDFPAGVQAVYPRTLWVRAEDEKNNVSDPVSMSFVFDRTFAEIIVKSELTDRQYLKGEYPKVELDINNVTEYWYLWAETPTNCMRDGKDYGDMENLILKANGLLSELMDRASMIGGCNLSPSSTNNVEVVLDEDTTVYGHTEGTWQWSSHVQVDETKRPLMLIIYAKGETTGALKILEFDTFYDVPRLGTRQMRFSTNDEDGQRQDNVRGEGGQYVEGTMEGSHPTAPKDVEGVYWPDDGMRYFGWIEDPQEPRSYQLPINTPSVHDVAEAEFYLAGDAITGLTRVDLDDTVIRLEKLYYDEAAEWMQAEPAGVVQEWSLGQLTLRDMGVGARVPGIQYDYMDMVYWNYRPAYSFTLNFDPAILTTEPFEYVNTSDGGAYRGVLYRFSITYAFKNDSVSQPEIISYWVFNNGAPQGLLYGVVDYNENNAIPHKQAYLRGGSNTGDPLPGHVAAILEGGEDVTPNVPVITFPGQEGYVQFAPWEFYELYRVLRRTPINDPSGAKSSYLGTRAVVRWGTEPDKLTQRAEISRFGLSAPVDTGPYAADGDEVTLYYRFEDEVKGTASPLYVVRLRRDDSPPQARLTVSETEALRQTVTVSVDSIFDGHMAGDVYITDTEADALRQSVSAWRRVIPGEEFNTGGDIGPGFYDPDTDFMTVDGTDYVVVRPDEEGRYTFVSNGFIEVGATDAAGNELKELTVNGQAYQGTKYLVNNIDLEPPAFLSGPTWTGGVGFFTLEAAVDETVVAAWLQFDAAYSSLLTGEDYSDGEPPLFALERVPGLYAGGLDPETGELDLKIYVQHSDTAALQKATLIVADSAGNVARQEHEFGGLRGVKAAIANPAAAVGDPDANVNSYPVYRMGQELAFTVPVKLNDFKTGFADAHGGLAIYQDGAYAISFTDLFGNSDMGYIYADIFGAGYAHKLTFSAGGEEVDPAVPTNQDITVAVDTGETDGLTVGGDTQTTWSATCTENGTVTYTLKNKVLGDRQIQLPISNIDKTPPQPYVTVSMDSARNGETGETAVYSITYTIQGFDESGVTMVGDGEGNAPSSVTFDAASALLTYTFTFRDAAGNQGTYTADAGDIRFSNPEDAKIVGCRLTYSGAGSEGESIYGVYSGGAAPDFGTVNTDILVKVEGLNAAGAAVPMTMTVEGQLPQGVAAFAEQKSILFTRESREAQSLTVTLTGMGTGNAISVPVTVPGEAIDKTLPIGAVYYREEGSSIRAYLEILCSDLAADGVSVSGHKGTGETLTLAKDGGDYYVEFDDNGSGYFVLMDKAGNVGTVPIAVIHLDNKPPVDQAEGWSGVIEASRSSESWQADLAAILSRPTNSSIKVFFSFNEQISRVEVAAYQNRADNVENPMALPDPDTYVTATASGNTVTVEFKQNCQARITVYDMRGNSTVLWRPEDGPVSVIDKEQPRLTAAPLREYDAASNSVTVTYHFTEAVMLTRDQKAEYKDTHEVRLTENGVHILTFADPAGNLFSHYPEVSELDEFAPHVSLGMELVGEGATLSGSDAQAAGNAYTSRNVRILLGVTDETPEGITVTARRMSGGTVPVEAEAVTVGGVTYTHHLTVAENGVYTITAADKWGQENIFYYNVRVIDTAAPTISMISSKAVPVERNADPEAVKSAVLQGVTAADSQSGANGGVTVTVDLTQVKLDVPGSYTATVTAVDRLGNKGQKTRTVTVLGGEARTFYINGQPVPANDVYTTTAGTLRVSTDDPSFGGEPVTLYYARGYLTAAQMKYATPFVGAEGFAAEVRGYYTVLAQSAQRGMHLVYIYVY